MNKVVAVVLGSIALVLANFSAIAAPKVTLGAAVGGPSMPSVEIPLWLQDTNPTAATLQFDVQFDGAQLTPAAVTPLAALGAHEIDFNVINAGNTLRIIITPPGDNAPMPTGKIATLRFDLPSGAVNGSQTLHVAQLESFTAQAVVVASITTLDGFIADASNLTADADSDGMTDVFEAANGLHPLDVADAAQDADDDGLTNLAEFNLGTNIYSTDTDGDGMSDKFEATYAGLNPLVNDASSDADGDGLSNIWEAKLELNPIVSDGTPLESGATLPSQINSNVVLVPDASYVTSGSVTITSGARLLLAPGSIVTFALNAQLVVSGQIVALGMSNNGVVFQSASAWKGVLINASSVGSRLSYTSISSASTSVTASGAAVVLRKCNFKNFSKIGVLFSSVDGGELTDSLIEGTNQLGFGVQVTGTSTNPTNNLTISGNTISGTFYGLQIGAYTTLVVTGNTLAANSYGLDVSGSGTDVSNPRPVIHGNRLLANTYANLQARGFGAGAAMLDATDNWWGSTDIPTIAAMIRDGANITGAAADPQVRFVPFLDGDGGVSTRGTALMPQYNRDMVIAANTTWDVVETLNVANGAQFRIEPGVTLRFYGRNTTLTANGQLVVQATNGAPATFTTGYATTQQSMWGGIVVNATSMNSDIAGAVIQSAKYGVSFNAVSGTISDSVVRNNMYGVVTTDASPTIRTSTIQGNNRGIDIERMSKPIIGPNNLVTANVQGVYVYGQWNKSTDPRPTVNGNSIYANSSSNFYAGNFQDGPNVVLDATNNWWGSTDVLSIMSSITDYYDDNAGPVVRFVTFLDGEGGMPVQGSALIGAIASGTVLVSGATYEVLETVSVPVGTTLTIPNGTRVRFHGAARELTIDGALVVQGSVANPVVFTSAKSNPVKGDWTGIRVNVGANATFNNAVVEWATDGISYTGAGGVLSNSVVRNNKTSGVYIKDASPTLQANTIQGNQFGIRVEQNSNPVINTGNVISGNTYGLYVYGNRVAVTNPKPVVTGNSIYNNTAHNYYAYNYIGGNSLTLEGSNNWWGTTDVAAILAKIYDNMDGADYSPKLTFLPFLDAQNGVATNGTVVTNTTVASNATYSSGQTYDVLSNVTVQSGATLTVESGAVVRFYTATSTLQVNGVLLVQGTSANPVRFTSSGSTTKGSWQGIVINTGSNGSSIDNAVVEYAKDGISFQANSGGAVQNCTVKNNSNAGIYIKDASPLIAANTVQGNAYGVYVERKSNPLIQDGNTITANTYGVYLKGVNQSGNDPMPVVNNNNISLNVSYNFYANTFYNAKNVSVSAAQNWWGSADVPTIVSKIYDNIDSRTTAPFVGFVPFLDAVQGAPTTGTVLSVTAPGVPSLTANTTYDLLDTLTVPVGETLYVPAGAKLRFYGIDTELHVNGQVQIQGTTAAPATLTSGLLTPAKGSWAGVVITPATSGSTIQSAVIEWASNGVFFNNSNGDLRGSTVRNNLNGVYVYQNAKPLITAGNVITANNIGVNIYGSRAAGLDPMPVVTGNSLFGNSPNNLKAYNFYNPASVHINATGNWWGTTTTSTINAGIYDYSDSASYSPIVDYTPILTNAP